MGRFENGTFWAVGRLVMGRFESGTFRDGTFCMFINISSSISSVIFPTFFSYSVSYLSPKYLISPPTPINVKPAVRGRLGIVKSLTVRYVKDWRMRRRVKTSEIVCSTIQQSWARLPLSVGKSVVRWSVGQRNSTYFTFWKCQFNRRTLISKFN
jgi:hypothetical protein